ncbi:hypothetical protein [Albibacterium sp.]|uniref:hypothetical protein n=1 Tax=Albibacterium sp. TaxID=2952885 RepID=UPI002BAFF4F4|nr:hypothetical protein [Albibacterium sp.]HUH18776.1 hypothetical protein [Albibacterium sp.]
MKIVLSILISFISLATYGQVERASQYYQLTLHGKAEDNGNSFHCIDTAKYADIPESVIQPILFFKIGLPYSA